MSAAVTNDTPQPLLSVRDLDVVYGAVIRASRAVSLDVHRGEVVTLLGANGAGKTTLLRAITGLLVHHGARITGGRVTLDGVDITNLPPNRLVRQGMSQVMEGRRIFAELNVEENLRTGAHTVGDRRTIRERTEQMMDLFPVLRDRRGSQAGYLSGGEQQMLAIGRALMSAPSILLLDEPSLGLAPLIVEQIWSILESIARDGTTILLVEQNAAMALSLADRGYVLETGRVAKEGTAAALRDDPEIRALYLGTGAGDTRRSYRAGAANRRSGSGTDDG